MSTIDLPSNENDSHVSAPLLSSDISARKDNVSIVDGRCSDELVSELEPFRVNSNDTNLTRLRRSSLQSCDISDRGRSCEQQDLLLATPSPNPVLEKYGSVKRFEPWFPNVNPEHSQAKTWRTWRSQRGVVLWGCFLTTSSVAVINLILAIWTWLHFETTSDGVVELYRGGCTVVKRANFLAHIVINVLGTLLFGASNLTLQILVAPTRSEVDQAHAKGIWLDIGVPSVRNLFGISKFRVILWSFLAITSIPIHFL